MKKWIVAASLLSFVHTSYACTAVNLSAKDGTVIAGRTMEWAFDMKWQINSIPKGTSIKLSAPAATKLPTVELATKYAVVGISPSVIPGPPALLCLHGPVEF